MTPEQEREVWEMLGLRPPKETKHAMHLVRLMRMGLEVLETGALEVRRHDAEELAAIRDGALSFEALVAEANRLQADMAEAARTTRLPEDVDHAEVDRLVLGLVRAESRTNPSFGPGPRGP